MKRLLDHLAGCARFGMRPGLEAIDAVAAALEGRQLQPVLV